MANPKLVTIMRNDTDEIYTFEITKSYSSNEASTITTYPTSAGTPHADNIYTMPKTFSLSLIIGGNMGTIDEWGSGTDRPKNALTLLKTLKDNFIPLTISTPQADHFNMYITGISTSNSNDDAYNLSAGLTFSELIIAKYNIINVGPFETETEAEDSDETDDGTNNGTNVGQTIIESILGGGLIVTSKVISAVISGINSAFNWLSGN